MGICWCWHQSLIRFEFLPTLSVENIHYRKITFLNSKWWKPCMDIILQHLNTFLPKRGMCRLVWNFDNPLPFLLRGTLSERFKSSVVCHPQSDSTPPPPIFNSETTPEDVFFENCVIFLFNTAYVSKNTCNFLLSCFFDDSFVCLLLLDHSLGCKK